MNIAHLLLEQSVRRPQAPAIIQGRGAGRWISFADLDARSARAAGFLSARGIRAGDHVLVFVPMSIDLYLALIAIFRIGAVATFLDPSASAGHINRCCQMTRPAAMIAIAKAHLLRLRCRTLREIPRQFTLGFPLPGAARWTRGYRCKPVPDIEPRRPDDPALLTFTSGSTGAPKGAVRSHGFLAAQHAALQRAIELQPGEIDLATLPIFSLANLASGVTSVIPDSDLRRPDSIDAAAVLRQIARQRVTRCVASPAFFQRLLDAGNCVAFLTSMRRVYTGGAPVFPGLLERMQQAMPLANVAAVYGSTEAEPIAHISFRDISADDAQSMFFGGGLLAGSPVPEIDLRIIPNHWGQPLTPATGAELDLRCLPAGKTGEIIVHGAHVLRGYLNGDGDEQAKWRVDDQIWHRTGDAGCMDARGRLWLMGRAEARIRDAAGELYPLAVECAASRITGVARSALIGHDGKRLLVVQRSAGAPADLETTLRRQLVWAAIELVRFVDCIPVDRRHNAKVDYPALRQMLTPVTQP